MFLCPWDSTLFRSFYPSERSAGDARGEGRKKIEAFYYFFARLRASLALLRFYINEAETTDTQATNVFNFVLCFFSMFFVCLFMFTFFCRSHYRCRHRCQRFLRGCLPLGQNNRKCWSQTLPPEKTWYVYKAGQSNWSDGSH